MAFTPPSHGPQGIKLNILVRGKLAPTFYFMQVEWNVILQIKIIRQNVFDTFMYVKSHTVRISDLNPTLKRASFLGIALNEFQ